MWPLLTPLTRTNTSAPTPAFLSDFLSVVASTGCDDLFGLDTLAESAWLEMKIGDASVVVPGTVPEGYNEERFIPVAMAFSEDDPRFRVHGRCLKGHDHTGKPKPKPR